MNRYGVLGHYLDCFASVTGQMQYDLFHVYTVDQHTLYVIRNIVRFLNPFFSQKFPLAGSVMSSIRKKEIIYLAAFFHDIAKGRGGIIPIWEHLKQISLLSITIWMTMIGSC